METVQTVVWDVKGWIYSQRASSTDGQAIEALLNHLKEDPEVYGVKVLEGCPLETDEEGRNYIDNRLTY